MIRDIVTYDIHSDDNPKVLTEKTRPVTDFTAEETVNCIRDLNDTLDDLILREGNKRGAIGLSATQIGVDLAMSAVTLGDKRYMLINPEITEKKGKDRLFRIGCFSLYEYRAMVRYNDDIVVHYNDVDGSDLYDEFTGDRSCVVQHEMDHLEGKLLFADLPNREADLFVPREAEYKDGKVPLKNHGRVFEQRRKLGKINVLSPEVYYSSLFNDYSDYVAYVEKCANEKKTLVELIKEYTPEGGKIAEAGCGTGALSVYFAKNGYNVCCSESDPDMMALAVSVNAQNGTDVGFFNDPVDALEFEDGAFDTIFSYEVLETLEDEVLAKAVAEGLRVAKRYVFMVPTIEIAANTLKGNERLRTSAEWLEFINLQGYRLLRAKEIDNGGNVIYVIEKP